MTTPLVLAAIAVISQPLTQVQFDTRRIRLESGVTTLRVEISDDSRASWSDYVLSSAESFMRATDRYLNSPLAGFDEFLISGDDDVHQNGHWVGGYNDRSTSSVVLQYDLSLMHDPGLLYHELAHFWFWGGVTDQEWLYEGIASFLPLAMHAVGDEIVDPDIIWSHWGFRYVRFQDDLPTLTDFRGNSRESFIDWYRKTFKIQYLIFRELGPQNYQLFVQELLASAPLLGVDAVIELLDARKKMDWHEFLSGWVFPEPYRRFSPDHFVDRDYDGLMDVEESFAATDPDNPDTDGDGIPDGAELIAGTNPLRPDPMSAAPRGPYVDGGASEWDALPTQEFEDPLGDSRGEDGLDLVRVRYLVRNDTLYVLAETAAAPTSRAGIFFDVLRDRDTDDEYDGDFAFWLDNPTAPWQYVPDEVRMLPGLRSAMGAVFEMAIPLEGIGTATFQFLPILRNQEQAFNYDEWDYWIRIVVGE